jgi:opine dehydrogenase
MFETIAIIGAGNGGKAATADLALQGKRVHLFEFPEYRSNIEALIQTPRLKVTGAITGEAVPDLVTCDLSEALAGVDTVMVCTQALGHERVARELAPLVQPNFLLILNPGSTGGTCLFAHAFRGLGLKKLPTMVEFATLTYGCRATGTTVDIGIKVKRVLYGSLPSTALATVGPALEAAYPGLVRAESVLEAGLNNANPVIHTPIALLNAARLENEGATMRFYRDGVSPTVAKLIEKLDKERMALLEALGYPAQSDPATSVAQGYATSTDYFECYARGPVFSEFTAPDTLDHRYFHEDMGMSLVMFCSLGKLLQVPTPTCEAIVRMGSIISGIDYFGQGARTLEALGLAGLNVTDLKRYLETGEIRSSQGRLSKG